MSTRLFYGSKKSSGQSSSSAQPKKKQRLDSVGVGEAIRISHGVSAKDVETLDDVSDLSDMDDGSFTESDHDPVDQSVSGKATSRLVVLIAAICTHSIM